MQNRASDRPPAVVLPADLAAVATSGGAALAAVRRLLDGRRAADRQELLLSTALEVIADGRLSFDSVASGVECVWPGGTAEAIVLRDALAEGQRLGLLRLAVDLAVGTQWWELTAAGRAEHDEQRDWWRAVRSRQVEEVVARAAQEMDQPSAAQAERWLDLIIDQIAASLREAAYAYLGELTLATGSVVRPRGHVDDISLYSRLRGHELAPHVEQFLGGCALAALDPSDPYGDRSSACCAPARCCRRCSPAGTVRRHGLSWAA